MLRVNESEEETRTKKLSVEVVLEIEMHYDLYQEVIIHTGRHEVPELGIRGRERRELLFHGMQYHHYPTCHQDNIRVVHVQNLSFDFLHNSNRNRKRNIV